MKMNYDGLAGLMTMMTGDEKHGPSATSTLDVLWVLYSDVMNIDPANPDDPDRDRFYLSKGHGPAAYYAVLAAHGLLDVAELRTFGQYDSNLGHHPDRTLVRGADIGSGSLGHGLGLAVGTAIALGIRQSPARVFVLIGDAELDEGSNAEAIQFAGRRRSPSPETLNLTAVVIDNESAGLGWPGGIASRFTVEGWTATDVDGRDRAALKAAFDASHQVAPHLGAPQPGASHGGARQVSGPHVVVAHVERKDGQ